MIHSKHLAPCAHCGDPGDGTSLACPRCGAPRDPCKEGSPRAPVVGDRLDGRYRLLAEVGRGGMGVVYRARDEALERLVAVKVLPNVGEDREAATRFLREARALAALDHPHVAAILHSGSVADHPYMVLRWLPGETAAATVAAARAAGAPGMAPSEAVRVMAAVCHGLHHAHLRCWLHRDVKPSNIMLGPNGHVTLMDFGVAKERFGAAITRDGRAFGTPEYLAPEVACGHTPASPASDLYAVGATLYELLVGNPPYEAPTHYALALAHLEGAIPDVRARRPDVEPGLAALITRALAKDPAARFTSARDLARALERLPADRRHAPRIAINRAFARLADFAQEYAADISATGCFIRSDAPLPVGTPVCLRLTILDDDFALVEGEGVVVHVCAVPGRVGMGVRFTALEPASEARLGGWLRTLTP